MNSLQRGYLCRVQEILGHIDIERQKSARTSLAIDKPAPEDLSIVCLIIEEEDVGRVWLEIEAAPMFAFV